jgi:hypothetical protein
MKETTYEACALDGLTVIGAIVFGSVIFPFDLACYVGILEVVKNVVEDIHGEIEDVDPSYFVAIGLECGAPCVDIVDDTKPTIFGVIFRFKNCLFFKIPLVDVFIIGSMVSFLVWPGADTLFQGVKTSEFFVNRVQIEGAHIGRRLRPCINCVRRGVIFYHRERSLVGRLLGGGERKEARLLYCLEVYLDAKGT